jgi:hypothetical protein
MQNIEAIAGSKMIAPSDMIKKPLMMNEFAIITVQYGVGKYCGKPGHFLFDVKEHLFDGDFHIKLWIRDYGFFTLGKP